MVRLYQGQGLREADGVVNGRLPAVAGLVGVDPDGELLFAQTPKRELVSLDLVGRRVDTVAVGVVGSATGPDGTLLAVDSNGRVVTLSRGTRLVWAQAVPKAPRKLFVASYGAMDPRLLAVVSLDSTRLVLASSDQPAAARTIPLGPTEASAWGDIVAVATDSGVLLVDPTGRLPAGFVRLADRARALAFSPSGHRVYVVLHAAAVAVVDRYERKELDGIPLPGEATALRVDPLGRWLALRPPTGDSAWIVDAASRRVLGAVPAEWSDDLPAFTTEGTLLARLGDDVVAFRADSLKRVGRVTGAADDLWLVALWSPKGRLALRPAAGGTAQAEAAVDSVPGEGPVYVQVSFSRNQAWAQELANSLQRAALPAQVLQVTEPDSGFRVVLGPYRTRVEAEVIGRRLGRPHTIYQPGQ
jgi:sporulation related protein